VSSESHLRLLLNALDIINRVSFDEHVHISHSVSRWTSYQVPTRSPVYHACVAPFSLDDSLSSVTELIDIRLSFHAKHSRLLLYDSDFRCKSHVLVQLYTHCSFSIEKYRSGKCQRYFSIEKYQHQCSLFLDRETPQENIGLFLDRETTNTFCLLEFLDRETPEAVCIRNRTICETISLVVTVALVLWIDVCVLLWDHLSECLLDNLNL
jgi:hypothetical protein